MWACWRWRRGRKITVAGVVIRQDADGRFCLNDLHKAAGGVLSQRPGYFLDKQQTKDLIAEIGSAGIPAVKTINGGRSPGTYVAKELVYAYANWISAPFYLQVIRTFDAVVTGNVGATLPS